MAGINAILYYLNSIFASAGFSQISGDQQAIAIGATNLIFTIVGMSLIDKLGRKTLLLIGAAGTASCLAGVAWLFATNSHPGALVWVLITYIAFFALSQGAVIWVYIGEVFPNAVRSKGQGVGNASHWIMNTIIALEFPVLVAHMGRSAPFTFFAVMTAVQFLVVRTYGRAWPGSSKRILIRRAGVGAGHLYCVLRAVSGCGYLGLHRRSVPQLECAPKAREWAMPAIGS